MNTPISKLFPGIWELATSEAVFIRHKDGRLAIMRQPTLARYWIELTPEDIRELLRMLLKDQNENCSYCKKPVKSKWRMFGRYCKTACRVSAHYKRRFGLTYNPNKKKSKKRI